MAFWVTTSDRSRNYGIKLGPVAISAEFSNVRRREINICLEIGLSSYWVTIYSTKNRA